MAPTTTTIAALPMPTTKATGWQCQHQQQTTKNDNGSTTKNTIRNATYQKTMAVLAANNTNKRQHYNAANNNNGCSNHTANNNINSSAINAINNSIANAANNSMCNTNNNGSTANVNNSSSKMMPTSMATLATMVPATKTNAWTTMTAISTNTNGASNKHHWLSMASTPLAAQSSNCHQLHKQYRGGGQSTCMTGQLQLSSRKKKQRRNCSSRR